MKNHKIYTNISLLFVMLFVLVSVITIPLVIKQITVFQLDTIYSNIDKKAETLDIIYEKGKSKNDFIAITQQTINNTLDDVGYLSIIDWTGNYVSYPDITIVGEAVPDSKTNDFNGDINGEKLYNRFFTYFNGLKEGVNKEIINLRPIKDSDLIVVYTLNFAKVITDINPIKENTYLTFLLLGFLMLLILVLIIRLTSYYSEKKLDQKLLNLEANSQNLSKLNESITLYQERIAKEQEAVKVENNESTSSDEVSKQRILTYVRNELVSILVTDIAYIYVENTITYLIRKDGKMATSGDSLDKIFSVLDKRLFFKTNRQFIVCITAIKKITKFENNKLKLQVDPKSEIDIIIGKNKASAFKQWLDM